MTDEKIVELQSGFNTAFLNSAINSNLAYRPQFIYNDNKNGQKVFSAIEDELLRCDRFAISVAFITRGGITPLLQTLKELERRGVPGRILTTDYHLANGGGTSGPSSDWWKWVLLAIVVGVCPPIGIIILLGILIFG